MASIDSNEHDGDADRAALKARYDAAHAEIMKGDYKLLQTDIDSGAVWSMGDGAVALAMKLLLVGAVMAPAEETKHPEGPSIPRVWILDGENRRGSIQGAEAYIAAKAAENTWPWRRVPSSGQDVRS